MSTTWLHMKNFASSSLVAAISDTDTSLTVQAGDGSLFGSTPFHAVLGDDSQGYEVVKVTDVTSDTFTITRAQESTSAMAFDAATPVRLAVTGEYVTEVQSAVNNIEDGTTTLDSVTASGTIQGETLTDGTATISGGAVSGVTTLETSGDVTVGGDAIINGNDIKSNGGITAISLSGEDVEIKGACHIRNANTTLGGRGPSNITVQGQTPGIPTRLEIYSKDGDGNSRVELDIFARGTPDSVSNRETVRLWYDENNKIFGLYTGKGGSGVLRPLALYTGSNTDQLRLNTDGSIAAGGGGFNIAADGFVTLSGNARCIKTLTFTANNLRTQGTSQDPTLEVVGGYIVTFAYGAGTLHEVGGVADIPCDYAEGTDLRVRLRWAPTTTEEEDVVWGIEYGIFGSGDILGADKVEETIVSEASGVAYAVQQTSDIIISGSGVEKGDILAFRVFRDGDDGDDEYSANALLVSVHICYVADSHGADIELWNA